ncbi:MULTISPECIES: 3-methyl-2-oxobutanoate hydroxymethyltransferase [Exiguobacterium]|uniref:3-methyl-2-oxobutanoate hydroxymethyltransferase n=1 Tax=Exiguobacterium oxidotolerans TaxID=223958 RepID=A0A653IDB5_9BACL|nr:MULTISPECIES: 3-methyl-2-oxobutanoate hydroxymethyltransferase [Exiguobacterium]ASI35648.1 3-methyl-2-oxobutanoate hydroxymethyltransferase [Exiguobacterium sp. N4-1P]VWX37036.1 ketopantoate hydroxymethyltransferase [Exiguobacterium oxidotolerans]
MHTMTPLLKKQATGEKLVMLTAYDYPSAKLAEAGAVDLLLVGDSLGNVILGYDSTIAVTVEDMIHHARAVRRGAPKTFMVVDMPFASYHGSFDRTLDAAARIFQESQADALKLEGAGDILTTIRRLTDAGMPCVAHLGLTPQSVGVLEGFKVQGKSLAAAEQLIADSLAAEQAGAKMLVLECVPHQLAKRVSELLQIPVIGIGAGVDVDGQVLVYHDILTYGVGRLPKFVKAYTDWNTSGTAAIASYVEEVKQGVFPSIEHTFTMDEELIDSLYGGGKE